MATKLTETGVDGALDFFHNITAFDAIECLCCVMKAGDAQVLLNGVYTCSLRDLYDIPEVYGNEPARNVNLSFYGGPPTECEMFEGNLLMLLVDHFLFCFTLNQTDSVEKALSYV